MALVSFDRIIPARAGFTATSRRALSLGRDHPRSRGVYAGVVESFLAHFGSSPLARGLRHETIDIFIWRRIIPARAGFTACCCNATENQQDHPRSRGVYRQYRDMQVNVTGSSPLARGLPSRTKGAMMPGRIIPARAGFTLLQLGADLPGQGSSPLARGLLLPARFGRLWRRIIPARAGFTPWRNWGTALSRGSSPLARGLPVSAPDTPPRDRIIPARAGFTMAESGLSPKSGGSSPLARGLLRSLRG